MRNKKFIIYGICLTLIGSFVGIKLYSDKTKSNNSSVVTNDTQKSKSNTEVNNTKSTEEPKAAIGGTATASSPSDTINHDITMIGTTPNTEGNTSGNSTNFGYFAKEGKWIYFTLPPANTKQYSIYRAMSDGETGLKAITEPGNFRSINVIGDWVYYINSTSYICRTKTDGSVTEFITEYPTSSMFIKDNFIYFTASDGIYKINLNSLNGDKRTLLAKGQNFNNIYVFDNVIYTSIAELKAADPTKDKGQIVSNLYTMNLDGSNLRKLSNDNMNRIIIYNNYLFYFNIDNQKFYRMNLNGSNKIQIFTYPISNYNISNNNIYFTGNGEMEDNIYKSDLDGKKIIKLTNHTYSNNLNSINFIININIIDDYVFYMGLTGTDLKLYKTKIDGSLERQLN